MPKRGAGKFVRVLGYLYELDMQEPFWSYQVSRAVGLHTAEVSDVLKVLHHRGHITKTNTDGMPGRKDRKAYQKTPLGQQSIPASLRRLRDTYPQLANLFEPGEPARANSEVRQVEAVVFRLRRQGKRKDARKRKWKE